MDGPFLLEYQATSVQVEERRDLEGEILVLARPASQLLTKLGPYENFTLPPLEFHEVQGSQ